MWEIENVERGKKIPVSGILFVGTLAVLLLKLNARKEVVDKWNTVIANKSAEELL